MRTSPRQARARTAAGRPRAPRSCPAPAAARAHALPGCAPRRRVSAAARCAGPGTPGSPGTDTEANPTARVARSRGVVPAGKRASKIVRRNARARTGRAGPRCRRQPLPEPASPRPARRPVRGWDPARVAGSGSGAGQKRSGGPGCAMRSTAAGTPLPDPQTHPGGVLVVLERARGPVAREVVEAAGGFEGQRWPHPDQAVEGGVGGHRGPAAPRRRARGARAGRKHGAVEPAFGIGAILEASDGRLAT